MVKGPGYEAKNAYDKANRLVSKSVNGQEYCAYTYDSLDRRVGGQYFDVKWRYSYDQFNQLTGAKSSTGDKFKYEYDAIGNRLKAENNNKMEAYAYNNLNQISSTGYAYDQWGNMVMTPDAQYAYDLRNRLVKVTKKDGTVIDYAYDAMDQRISSTVNSGKKTEFLMTGMVEYARKENDAALYHTLGLDLAGSLYRTGAVGAVLASGDMSYLYDGNGNVIGVMQDGKITHKLAYEPFGKQTTNVNLPFTFSTKSVDQSDMSYYGYRFLTFPSGKWISRDPLENMLYEKQDFDSLSIGNRIEILRGYIKHAGDNPNRYELIYLSIILSARFHDAYDEINKYMQRKESQDIIYPYTFAQNSPISSFDVIGMAVCTNLMDWFYLGNPCMSATLCIGSAPGDKCRGLYCPQTCQSFAHDLWGNHCCACR